MHYHDLQMNMGPARSSNTSQNKQERTKSGGLGSSGNSLIGTGLKEGSLVHGHIHNYNDLTYIHGHIHNMHKVHNVHNVQEEEQLSQCTEGTEVLPLQQHEGAHFNSENLEDSMCMEYDDCQHFEFVNYHSQAMLTEERQAQEGSLPGKPSRKRKLDQDTLLSPSLSSVSTPLMNPDDISRSSSSNSNSGNASKNNKQYKKLRKSTPRIVEIRSTDTRDKEFVPTPIKGPENALTGSSSGDSGTPLNNSMQCCDHDKVKLDSTVCHHTCSADDEYSAIADLLFLDPKNSIPIPARRRSSCNGDRKEDFLKYFFQSDITSWNMTRNEQYAKSSEDAGSCSTELEEPNSHASTVNASDSENYENTQLDDHPQVTDTKIINDLFNISSMYDFPFVKHDVHHPHHLHHLHHHHHHQVHLHHPLANDQHSGASKSDFSSATVTMDPELGNSNNNLVQVKSDAFEHFENPHVLHECDGAHRRGTKHNTQKSQLNFTWMNNIPQKEETGTASSAGVDTGIFCKWDSCGKQFSSLIDLQAHILKEHVGNHYFDSAEKTTGASQVGANQVSQKQSLVSSVEDNTQNSILPGHNDPSPSLQVTPEEIGLIDMTAVVGSNAFSIPEAKPTQQTLDSVGNPQNVCSWVDCFYETDNVYDLVKHINFEHGIGFQVEVAKSQKSPASDLPVCLFEPENVIKSEEEEHSCTTECHVCKWDGCEQVFHSCKQLDEHLEKDHLPTGQSSYTCLWDSCGKLFKQRQKLHRHLKVHSCYKGYQCTVCDKYFSTQDILAAHLKTHKKKLECERCDKEFSTEITLDDHRKKHDLDKKWVCDKCGRVFNGHSNYYKHLKTHNYEFKCSKCSKSYKKQCSLESHIKKMHSEDDES